MFLLIFQRDSVTKWLQCFRDNRKPLVRNVVLNLITIESSLINLTYYGAL